MSTIFKRVSVAVALILCADIAKAQGIVPAGRGPAKPTTLPKGVHVAFMYYQVPDRAFARAAETLHRKYEEIQKSLPQTAETRMELTLHPFRTLEHFKAEWALACTTADKEDAAMQVYVFSHASRSLEGGLEFSDPPFLTSPPPAGTTVPSTTIPPGNTTPSTTTPVSTVVTTLPTESDRTATLTRAEIHTLKKPKHATFSMIWLFGCNTGQKGRRGWCPAEEFNIAHDMTAYGMNGFATFSSRIDKYEEIDASTRDVYLLAFDRRRNAEKFVGTDLVLNPTVFWSSITPKEARTSSGLGRVMIPPSSGVPNKTVNPSGGSGRF